MSINTQLKVYAASKKILVVAAQVFVMKLTVMSQSNAQVLNSENEYEIWIN